MKNFTKQILNKTLFKPTRWLLVALMFLLGTASAWAWTVYYDNSATKWSTVYLVIGHDSYRRGNYTMTKVSGYDNLYSYTATDWADAKYVAFSSTSIAASSSSLTGLGIPYYIFDANMTNANNKIFGGTAYVSDKAQLVLNDYIGFYIGEPTSWNQSRFFIWKTENSKNSYQAGGNTAETQGSNKLQIVYAKSGTYSLTHSASWAGVSTGAVKAGYGYYIGDGNAMKTLTPTTAPSYTFKLQTPISQGSTSTVSSETGTGKSMYGTKTVALDSYYIQKSGESTFTKITKSGSALQTQNLAVGTYQVIPVVYDGKIYFKGTPQTLVIEDACTPPAAPTLNSNSTTVCSGTSFDLPSGYRWYTVATGGTKLSSNTISAGITAKTIYYAEAGEDGCVSTSRTAYTVNVDAKSALTLKANPTICQGSSIKLSDYVQSSTGTVKWYSNSGMTTEITNPSEARTPQSNPTYYYARATSGVCSSVDKTLTVTLSPQPAITLKAAPTICNGTTVTFANYVNTHTGTVTWHTKSDFSDAAITSAKPSQTTTYYAKASSGDCTPATASLKVTVNDKPGKPTLGASKTALVAGERATLTVANTVTDATYTLYKDGVSTGKTGTSFIVSDAGSYTVIGKNDCGESETSTAVVITVCDPIKSAKLYFADSNYNKLDACPTYCAGSTAYFVLEYTGERDGNKTWTRSDNFATNLKGTETNYYFTINSSGTISVTLPTCDGTTVTTNTLTYPTENITTAPVAPTVSVITNEVITCNETSFVQKGKIQITNYSANNDYIIGDNDNSPVNVSEESGKAYIYFDFGGTFTLKARNKACSLTGPKSAQFTITESDNAPTITGNNSFQPNGSTTLTSDKGASTTWVALDGGDLNTRTGASVVFTAKENGTYHVQATYNGCSTTITIKVQDDIYVWMRKPNKKENAYNNFYYINENPTQGGMMYYKEFTSKPTTVPECNQGGREADKECTDKEGYTWYGYVISKAAIEANTYYFTVHAANPNGKNGIYTHTLPYKLENVTSDLYFVMDETGSNDGWYINAPVVVRASGDASFNGNNFADFVPLYVKDANICGKEVVSFEWQKSASQNGTYTTYKSGKGINNIRTREAGWYRCVVTYGDGKGTATSNAIQVTNSGGNAYSFTSNLPIIMVNTNGVGFPDECTVSNKAYPSSNADKMKEKISVDVIIKKGDEILYDRKARMNYRGSSSLNFKKKSYAFVSGQDSCVFDKSRHDYVKTKKAKMLNILGLDYAANDKDWVLYAATADPSMIRNRLVFDLYQKMRPQDWGVHSTYVELVVDGVYKGVYVFMDKITANEKRVNIVDGTGFIVKWDKTDVADRYVDGNDKDSDEKTFATTRTGKKGIGTYDTTVDQLFEIEYPEKEDIVDAGGSWASTVETIKQRFEDFETALEAKNYEQVRAIIDYDSWADWFILNEYTKNLDAYRASCIFTCKGQGYKIQAVPLWDQELSFNNAAANISGKGSNSTAELLIQNGGVYSDAFPAPFWFTGGGTNITGGLLNDPCFISLVKEKWAAYTAEGGVLTSAKVDAMVDAYKADLGAIGTAGTPIYRENAMIPFNDSSKAGRGSTSSCTGSKAIGYFGYGDNCGSAVTHDSSVSAIKNWIPYRISGFGTALAALKGEALIFLVSPAQQDVTPWQTALVKVQAPSGYTYSIDYSAITNAGGEVKNADNTYSVKLPRPAGWEIGGNGDAGLSKNYEIKASIELEDEGNTCGVTATMETKTATITLKDEIEDCDPVVTR